MTEFKTFKDMHIIYNTNPNKIVGLAVRDRCCIGKLFEKSGSDMILKGELREEAIKWAKDIHDQSSEATGQDKSWHEGKLNFIMEFFNLSEEDLNEKT